MDSCIFCKIVSGEIPSKKIYEDDFLIAFLDINPMSFGHTILIPKKHFLNLEETDDQYLSKILIASKKIVKFLKNNISEIKGFNYLSNQEKIAGQEINHFHFHIIPKYKEDYGFKVTANIDNSFKNNELIDKIILKKIGSKDE